MIEIIQYKLKLYSSNLVFLFKHNYSGSAVKISNVVADISAHSDLLDMPDFLLSNTIMYHGEKKYSVGDVFLTCTIFLQQYMKALRLPLFKCQPNSQNRHIL